MPENAHVRIQVAKTMPKEVVNIIVIPLAPERNHNRCYQARKSRHERRGPKVRPRTGPIGIIFSIRRATSEKVVYTRGPQDAIGPVNFIAVFSSQDLGRALSHQKLAKNHPPDLLVYLFKKQRN